MTASAPVTRHACPSCLAVFRRSFARCPLDGAVLGPIDKEPLLGVTLASRYVVEACIGEGGMGQVYRAKHTRLSRRFAIKVLYGDLVADSTMRERFSREAEAASRLSHPNLVSVVDFGETDKGLLYLVMEYVDGVSLANLITKNGPLGDDRTMNLLRQMAAGLQHAHEKNLVHRDFKPDNVMVISGSDGELAKILDFGIARIVDDGVANSLTTQGMVMGTPAFMAPEQATGGKVDRRSDLFSLGLAVYEMASGVLPFDGDAMSLLRQNFTLNFPPIAERVPGIKVDPRIEALARKLAAKKPEERFQNAGDLLAEIDSWWTPARSQQTPAGTPVAQLAQTVPAGAGQGASQDADQAVSAAGKGPSLGFAKTAVHVGGPESLPGAPDANQQSRPEGRTKAPAEAPVAAGPVAAGPVAAGPVDGLMDTLASGPNVADHLGVAATSGPNTNAEARTDAGPNNTGPTNPPNARQTAGGSDLALASTLRPDHPSVSAPVPAPATGPLARPAPGSDAPAAPTQPTQPPTQPPTPYQAHRAPAHPTLPSAVRQRVDAVPMPQTTQRRNWPVVALALILCSVGLAFALAMSGSGEDQSGASETTGTDPGADESPAQPPGEQTKTNPDEASSSAGTPGQVGDGKNPGEQPATAPNSPDGIAPDQGSDTTGVVSEEVVRAKYEQLKSTVRKMRKKFPKMPAVTKLSDWFEAVDLATLKDPETREFVYGKLTRLERRFKRIRRGKDRKKKRNN